MRTRSLFMVCALVLLVSLGIRLHVAQAQSRQIQLCGFTQFVDFVIIDATVHDGSRLVLPSSWIQIAPHIYTLMGSGPFIRDPLLTDPNLFMGQFMLVNTSSSFFGNPACTADVTLLNTSTSLAVPTFAGTATLLCFGGSSGRFQVTLQLNLTTCDEPGFPGIARAPAREALEPLSALERVPLPAVDETNICAGDAPNEHGQASER